MVWLLVLSMAFGDDAVRPTLDDVDVDQLVALAQAHPRIEAREAETRFARNVLRQARLTPVQGVSVSAGVVEGQNPLQGPQLTGTVGLTLNVLDLATYRPRIRAQQAKLSAAEAAVLMESRQIEREVRLLWITLREVDERLALGEEAVSMLSLQHEVAEERFLAKELQIDDLSSVYGTLLTARVQLAQTRREYAATLLDLKTLTGVTLADTVSQKRRSL